MRQHKLWGGPEMRQHELITEGHKMRIHELGVKK